MARRRGEINQFRSATDGINTKTNVQSSSQHLSGERVSISAEFARIMTEQFAFNQDGLIAKFAGITLPLFQLHINPRP